MGERETKRLRDRKTARPQDCKTIRPARQSPGERRTLKQKRMLLIN